MTRALVTGATGFLGRAIATELQERGVEVTTTGRSEKKGAALTEAGSRFVPANLQNRGAIASLCEKQDWVFHCAALSSAWGTKDAFFRANVVGTENVIAGCEQHEVSRLVHVSTPSVYFEFKDRLNVRESDPLPDKFINHYASTKFEAEQRVLAASKRGLFSVMLRPRAIFGPGDTTLFPRIVRNLESGKLKIIGDGENTVHMTYIDNCVQACLLAATSETAVDGAVYNITDDEPVKLWHVLRRMADALNLAFPTRRIGAKKARFAAKALEAFHRRFRPSVEPLLTEYAVGILTQSFTLCTERAKKELGYAPTISTDEGIDRFLAEVLAER